MKQFKKLFAVVASVAMAATMLPTTFAATYSTEVEGAYSYAYANSITTVSTIDAANPYGKATRAQVAKMIANWAEKEADDSIACSFSDSAAAEGDLAEYMVKACKMGLMGQGITAFRPNDTVTRGEFATVLSRALWGEENNGGTPFYTKHMEALKTAWIMNVINNPEVSIQRYEAWLMLMRSDVDYTPEEVTECTVEEVLACATSGDDIEACLAACAGSDSDDDEDEVEVIVRDGELNVNLQASVGGNVPYGISSLPVATYRLTSDRDVTLASVVLSQVGFGDDDTLENVALFIDGKRVSKTRSIDLNKDVTLNLTSAYTVKKGASVDLTIQAQLGGEAAGGSEFAIVLKEVNSSAKNAFYGSKMTSATYKLVSTAAATIEFDDKSAVIEPKIGAKGADIFEFNLKNTGASKQDVTLTNITLMWIGADAKNYDDYLANLNLVVDGTSVASAQMDGKYVTFNLAKGYVIEEGKSPTFTVTADIIGGASQELDFTVENTMDIVAIANNHNTPVAVVVKDDSVSSVTILAGRVTIERTNPTSLEFVGNRTDVYLGSFTVINNAGGDLRIEDFDLTFVAVGTTDLTEILDTVKVKYWSVNAGSIELDGNTTSTIWSSDTEVNIGKQLVIHVYADINDTSVNWDRFYMELDDISIVETQDDENVTEISYPNKWSTMQGKEGELALTRVFLANKSFSKGTSDIEALKFNLKAGSVYGSRITNIVFDSAPSINTNTIRSATLYKGDEAISATVTNGGIRVNNVIELDANETATFTLKVDLVSNPTTTSFAYSLSGSNIEAQDISSDRNEITIGGRITGRTISVVEEGTVFFNYELNADENESAKSILAGQSAVVAEYNLYTDHEEATVGEIVVTFNQGELDASIANVELTYGEKVIGNPTWNTDGDTVTFSNVDLTVIKEETSLYVKVTTAPINADGGLQAYQVAIDSIELIDVLGKDSGNEITVAPITSNSNEFDIAPVTVVASITNQQATSAKLNLFVNRGSNTTDTSTIARATIEELGFDVTSNNGGLLSFRVEDKNGNLVGNYTSGGAETEFYDVLLWAGNNEFTIYFTQDGTINTPSYTVRLSDVRFSTNVDNNNDEFSNRMTSPATIISK